MVDDCLRPRRIAMTRGVGAEHRVSVADALCGDSEIVDDDPCPLACHLQSGRAS
jgi:hypothetical protein